MTSCKFSFDDEKQLWVCSVCGRTIKAPKTNIVHATCRSKPTMLTQAVNYTKAVVQHIATGAKTCTDEEVAARLVICQACESYATEKQYCRLCGCSCNVGKSPFLNKLRMKSQECPKGKWK